MRAWVCRSLDGLAGLRHETDAPEPPAPGPEEVTVALDAAALNFPDLLMLSGGYQYRPEPPFVPGMEGAGHIVAVGEALSGELIGTRVIVGARGGCLAERVTVPANQVRPAPDDFSQVEAAAFTVCALTAWVSLVDRGRLAPGERLVVLGAGGGVGLAAVALGAALGAEVVAIASDEAKLSPAAAAGAVRLVKVERSAPDLSALVDSANLVFDPVGGSLLPPALRTLCWGGRYLLVGFAGGMPEPLALNRLLLKGVELIGVRAGEQGRRDPVAGARHLTAIDALAAEGKLRPHIGLAVPFERSVEALGAMAAGTLVGKAVIEVSRGD